MYVKTNDNNEKSLTSSASFHFHPTEGGADRFDQWRCSFIFTSEEPRHILLRWRCLFQLRNQDEHKALCNSYLPCVKSSVINLISLVWGN